MTGALEDDVLFSLVWRTCWKHAAQEPCISAIKQFWHDNHTHWSRWLASLWGCGSRQGFNNTVCVPAFIFHSATSITQLLGLATTCNALNAFEEKHPKVWLNALRQQGHRGLGDRSEPQWDAVRGLSPPSVNRTYINSSFFLKQIKPLLSILLLNGHEHRR